MSFIPPASKLVSAAMLQDLLINKEGEPLAAGVVTMYQDSNRALLKNWYYQIGVAGNYTYVALPNPMILSAAGTIIDVNGNDVIPFYFPWNELDDTLTQLYFITVYDSNGQLQFTRSGFPFTGGAGTPTGSVSSSENYVVNNRFWRNVTKVDVSMIPTNQTWTYQYNLGSTVFYQTLCPDQHDSFSMPDVNYVKNINGTISPDRNCNEVITFSKFPVPATEPVIIDDIQPEYYINFNCLLDTTGAGLKVFQFPISLHQATLANQDFTFTMQGRSNGGSGVISAYIYAFAGSGVASNPPELIDTHTFGSNWSKWTANFTFPSVASVSGTALGTGQDDAFYLQILMPTGSNAVCNFDFCLPSIYLVEKAQVPINSFSTYDQIDSVINTPRTGDIRTSLNSFYYYGWLPMNNGTIGYNPADVPAYTPTARNNPDTWPLYNLLWNNFHSLSTGGSPLVPIYDSSGAPSTYGTSAISDWTLIKSISLTKSMGQVLLGTVPLSALLPATPTLIGYSSVVTASNSAGVLWTTDALNLLNLFQGNTVVFSSTSALVNVTANTVYYVVPATNTTFHVATSFTNALAGTFVPFTGAESGIVTASLQPFGSYEGEYAHHQLTSEVGSHAHAPGAGTGFATNNVTSTFTPPGTTTVATGSTNPTALNQPDGSVASFNVTQPGTFLNLYIKL